VSFCKLQPIPVLMYVRQDTDDNVDADNNNKVSTSLSENY
jgi:hypothetical protein